MSDDPLTPREAEVLKLIAEAHANQQTAELLVISPKTVENHRARILEKLGMRDRVEVTRVVCDPMSPLYNRHSRVTVAEIAGRARAALSPG